MEKIINLMRKKNITQNNGNFKRININKNIQFMRMKNLNKIKNFYVYLKFRIPTSQFFNSN